MKKLYILLFALLMTSLSFGQTVFINEIHYDDAGADTGEGFEIAGPAGTDLTNWTVAKYNGSNNTVYGTENLSGSIPDEGGSGFGTLWFGLPANGLQNGAPDGLALVAADGTTVIQFLSYEGVITASGGPADTMMSTDIGVMEAGVPEGQSLQLSGTGTVYANFTWNAPSAASTGLINPGQTFGVAVPAITITAPTNGTAFAPGTTSVNVEWTTTNLGGSETVDITINGSQTLGVTSPFAVTTTDGQTYNITVDLVDVAVIDSDITSFSVGSLTQVIDIAALIADVGSNGVGGFYEITGGVLVTHTDAFRNRKWIQDSNISGVLIYDQSGTIATTYAVGDMVTGLKGTTTTSSGVLRFVPTEDAGVIASSGNPVTPQVVTIAAFNAAPDDYESELIRINNVTFDIGDGLVTFATGTNYNVSVGADIVIKRTDFFGADYIGQLVPTGQIPGIVGVAGEFNGTAQIYVRSLSDMTLATNDFNLNSFKVFPNPTSLGYINIVSKNNETINAIVFDILGKQVINSTVTNNKLDVSNLNMGVYIMRLTQNNATITKKLVIN